jgi:anti-sigma-K factor RskA
MMTHDEVNDLIASFALDAVESEESVQIEQHLEHCPRCRAELDAHREVAAALGNSVEPLPEGLWTSISNRLPERKDAEPPPMPQLVHDDPGSNPARPGRRHRSRSARNRLATVGALAVAAAAVAAVLGINLVRVDDQVAHLQHSIGTAAPTAVEAALETPGHQVVRMVGANHKDVAQFVIVPDGRGYLISSALPGLSSKQTYQLWAIVGGQPISMGLLGQSPYMSTFTLDGSPAPTRLGITVEPSGGSVVPSSPMVASGTV